jgi:uncharacterized protein (TIGR00255 family)
MTVHSMTAFARESCSEPCTIVVELRSVNQRYLDLHFKLPDTLRALEPRLREAFGKALKRGKIDCQLRLIGEDGSAGLQLDRERLATVLELLSTLRKESPELAAPDALNMLQFPGICTAQATDEKTLQAAAMALFERALESLLEGRDREGAQLEGFLEQRLEAIAKHIDGLRQRLPELRQSQEARLRSRLRDLQLEVDEGRLEQELVYLAQKSDVEEELDRLDAHVAEARRILDQGGPCGRRLDFLMQEFNREANTLSSKSTTGSTTQIAVELKVLIEQMREQVQNIE